MGRGATRLRGHALAAAVSLVTSGCAFSGAYEPRLSHRLARVGSSERTFVRDGQRFDLGLAGDAVPLVRGNELAEAHARKFRRNQITALVLYGAGLGALATGIGVFYTEPRDGSGVTGTLLLSSSLVLMLASIPFLIEARASLFDAVNIYNDALDASPAGAFAPRPITP